MWTTPSAAGASFAAGTTATAHNDNHREDNLNESSERGSTSPSEEDSTCAATSSSPRRSPKDVDTKAEERATLARRENVIVIRMKGVVAVVLLAATILVSIGVLWYTRADQEHDFKESFKADANRLLESFHKSLERTLEAVDALSVAITAHALETNSTFPFVNLPNSAFRFGNARVLSGSPYIEYLPLVTDDTRADWEAYVREHGEQYMAAYQIDEVIRKHQDLVFEHEESGRRHTQDAQPTGSSIPMDGAIINVGLDGSFSPAPPDTGPYLPVWSFSPTMPPFLCTNALVYPLLAGGFNETLQTGEAVVDLAANLDDGGGAAAFFTAILSISQYRYDVSAYVGDPTSSIAYPVFDSFDLETRKVAGVIGSMIYWRLLYKDVLSSDTRGIHCVLENNKGQVMTYQVDDKVTFLGSGDLHDRRYDSMMESGDLAEYIASKASPETKSYTSVDLNTKYCSYKLRIYPSQATENQHVNRDPIKVCMVVVSVFVFTSIVFVMYTVAVNRRQEVVMDRAVASSAIVSSLFPSQVRDQIYHANDAEQGGFEAAKKSNEADSGYGFSRPIAELYENTTILFADIAGFTSWSSKREPVSVFELLETIYKAFDAIAVRRKVFKVETIGDCYVAVTGLPEPQADHAVIMSRFADDCMRKMRQLTSELAGVLGQDTSELELRIGLHSGPVTGGVLRGQKSRFQLFGDTMNTASRMESNSVKGMIHVSQETADELIARGKASWVTPREDKIIAKGKGELQTYWMNPHSPARAQSASSSIVSSETQSVGDDTVLDGRELIEL